MFNVSDGGGKAFSFRGAKIWNCLVTKAKLASSLRQFLKKPFRNQGLEAESFFFFFSSIVLYILNYIN